MRKALVIREEQDILNLAQMLGVEGFQLLRDEEGNPLFKESLELIQAKSKERIEIRQEHPEAWSKQVAPFVVIIGEGDEDFHYWEEVDYSGYQHPIKIGGGELIVEAVEWADERIQFRECNWDCILHGKLVFSDGSEEKVKVYVRNFSGCWDGIIPDPYLPMYDYCFQDWYGWEIVKEE